MGFFLECARCVLVVLPDDLTVVQTASIEGIFVRSLTLRDREGNEGLAVSPDGTRLAVSNWNSSKIILYTLPDGAFLAEFGGEGEEPGLFNNPQKMCFSKRTSGNLLIADCGNQRVQVC